MKNTKHTPGPWGRYLSQETKRVCADGSTRPAIVVDGSGMNIGTILPPETLDGVEEWQANAALIAAAPELLAALKWLTTPGYDISIGMKMAMDAIAKAEEK